MDVTTLSPKVRPGLEGEHIQRVVNIPSQNLMAYCCHYDSRILVYKNDDASRQPVYIFENHVSPDHPPRRVYLFHLSDDLMCSMQPGGNVITWLARSGEVLDTFKVARSKALEKLSDTRLAVVLNSGAILVIEHLKGRGIHQLREIPIRSRNIVSLRSNGSVL